jgi:hypothetical protein
MKKVMSACCAPALKQKPHDTRIAIEIIAVRIWQSSPVCLGIHAMNPELAWMVAIFWIARKQE